MSFLLGLLEENRWEREDIGREHPGSELLGRVLGRRWTPLHGQTALQSRGKWEEAKPALNKSQFLRLRTELKSGKGVLLRIHFQIPPSFSCILFRNIIK